MPTNDASATSIADEPLQTPAGSLAARLLDRLNARLEARFEAERDQLPLWLPVGLGLGIAAWFALPDVTAWLGFLLVAGSLFLGAIALGPETRWGQAVALFSLVAAIGCGLIWAKAERVAAAPLAHPKMASFQAIVEQVQPQPARELTRLVVRPVDVPGLPTKLRINVDDEKTPAGISAGARVQVRAWLMPPAPMAVPGAYDFSRAAWFQGIGGSGRALEIHMLAPAGESDWRSTIASWRNRLAAHIRSRLEGGAGGIAVSLATGDQHSISEEDAEAMRRSGLAHLFSVSGLHLTAVVGAVMLLTLKLLALSPRLALHWPLMLIAAAAAALAGVAYTLLTGAEVPTVRACIAALLVLLAIALGREALTLRLVATGALIVLLLWPESLAGASFQLSFAAMVAIVALHEHPRIRTLLARREEGLVQRLGRGLLGLALTGLAVEAALSPIALYHFHKAGVYGALANMVAIPLTTFVIMPLEGLALLFDLAGIGAPFWWAAGVGLEFLLSLAHATANAPGAVATLPVMPTGAFALMVSGGLWLALWRSDWRRWGLVPMLFGMVWALSTPAPDLIVTGDGRHLALRGSQGGFALLRPRAGDYVRDLLGESSGSEAELADLETLPEARCSRDLCTATIDKNGRRWQLLATRSSLMVPVEELARVCARADIVVSDRRLPRTCLPRWLKADRSFLRRSGGLAISFEATPQVRTVAERTGRHPWAEAGR